MAITITPGKPLPSGQKSQYEQSRPGNTLPQSSYENVRKARQKALIEGATNNSLSTSQEQELINQGISVSPDPNSKGFIVTQINPPNYGETKQLSEGVSVTTQESPTYQNVVEERNRMIIERNKELAQESSETKSTNESETDRINREFKEADVSNAADFFSKVKSGEIREKNGQFIIEQKKNVVSDESKVSEGFTPSGQMNAYKSDIKYGSDAMRELKAQGLKDWSVGSNYDYDSNFTIKKGLEQQYFKAKGLVELGVGGVYSGVENVANNIRKGDVGTIIFVSADVLTTFAPELKPLARPATKLLVKGLNLGLKGGMIAGGVEATISTQEYLNEPGLSEGEKLSRIFEVVGSAGAFVAIHKGFETVKSVPSGVRSGEAYIDVIGESGTEVVPILQETHPDVYLQVREVKGVRGSEIVDVKIENPDFTTAITEPSKSPYRLVKGQAIEVITGEPEFVKPDEIVNFDAYKVDITKNVKVSKAGSQLFIPEDVVSPTEIISSDLGKYEVEGKSSMFLSRGAFNDLLSNVPPGSSKVRVESSVTDIKPGELKSITEFSGVVSGLDLSYGRDLVSTKSVNDFKSASAEAVKANPKELGFQYKLEKKGGQLSGKMVYSPVVIGNKRITVVDLFVGEVPERVFMVETVAGKPIIVGDKPVVSKVGDKVVDNFGDFGGVGTILEKPDVKVKGESVGVESDVKIENPEVGGESSKVVVDKGKVKVLNPNRNVLGSNPFEGVSSRLRGSSRFVYGAKGAGSVSVDSKELTGSKPSVGVAQIGGVGSVSKLFSAQVSGQVVGQVSGVSVVQASSQLVTPRIISKFTSDLIRDVPRNPNPRVPPVIGFGFFKAKVGESVFNVEIRRQGKFKVVASNVPLGKAFNIGKETVGNTAGASFRVVPINQKGAIELQSKLGLGLGKGLYLSKKESGVIIEKPSYRIKSSGEISEITMKGIQANKKKNRGGLW